MAVSEAAAVTDVAKPLPVPDDLSAGFWDAASRHELRVQQCTHCGRQTYPPTTICTCLTVPVAFSWVPVQGGGRVKTWTVVRQAFLPGYAPDVPYVVADVELDEAPGVRVAARLRDVDVDDVRAGMAVDVAFDDVADDIALPYFRPTAGTS